MDISTISAIFTSLKSATDIAKLIKESDISFEKAETKLKLAELIGALADVKMQLADVRELIIDKDEELRKLQEEMKVKGNLVFEMPYYWLNTEQSTEGPYCQAFYDTRIGESDCTCEAANRALRFSETEAEIPHDYLKSDEEAAEIDKYH